MTLKLYILVVVAWTGWAEVQATDYCKITPEHTMCMYPNSGRGPACGPDVAGGGVSSTDAAAIVKAHNEFRAKVANGGEKEGAPGPQPSGANIRALKWDDELATVAQRLTDQCAFRHDCNACRLVDRFYVGQNIFMSMQSDLTQTGSDWHAAVKEWYDEVPLFPNTGAKNYTDPPGTGHYTQVLWADTALVGCGYTPFQSDGWLHKLYACNYGPGGNMLGSPVYLEGAACSACPAGTSCSKENPGLCA